MQMMFGSANKFRIRRSQSKASSYLAARREREHGMVIGRYKRTMSPSGGGVGGGGGAGAVDKETTSNNNSPHRLIRANNNSNLVRRASLVELKCVIDDKNKSPLPDVLPVNAKVLKSESPCTTLVKNIESSSSPPAAPVENSEPKVIAGLQFIQRTEVTLRVNSCTIDVASQTEDNDYDDDHYATTMNTSSARRKLLDEIECERLSQDLASQLSSSDRLKCILVPDPEHKRPTDYVSDLFKIQVTSRLQPVHSTFRTHTPNSSPPLTPQVVNTTSQTEQTTIQTVELTLPSSVSTTYLTSSEPKTQFLTQYSRDMNQFSNNILKNTKDLHKKKEELVNRLDKKLAILKSEELVVSEECRVNDELGESVERHVSRVARPHEAAKFRLHVEEVGKITSLLLALSGRLATVENTLMGFSVDENEKKILENKRDKLHEQLEEAKKLKESIDKRSINVSNILYKYLNSEEYADYDHFINMKAKLIMDSREITDKIKLAEEQLSALKEALAFHQDYS